jgi:outer membrane usher protein
VGPPDLPTPQLLEVEKPRIGPHAQRRRPSLRQVLLASVLCAGFSQLPRVARAQDAAAEPLYLSPWVNGVTKPGVVTVLQVPGGVLIASSSLKTIGIEPDAGTLRPGGERFFPRTGPERADVDMASQVIRFTVPQGHLFAAVTSLADPPVAAPARAGTGAFVNYAFSVTPPTNQATNRTPLQVSGDMTGVLFSPAGFISSSALLQAPRQTANNEPLVTRLNTTYELDQPAVPRAFRAGDIVTDPPGWGRAEFMGGLQVATDDQLQPSRVTFPTPVIGQTLAEPSDVSLLVNNAAAYQGNADAGPFSLVGIPVVSGLNEITVQTRSDSGTVISRTVPFYASETMLAPGLHAYNVSLGFIRYHYGQTDNLYSTPAFDGSFDVGLSDWLTMNFHAEGAPNLALGGGGFETSGVWGDLAAAGAVSWHRTFGIFPRQEGRLYSVQYTRSSGAFGISAGIVSATSGFSDLGLETSSSYPELTWHASASAILPFHLGNVAVAYTVQSAERHNRDAFLLGSYSIQLSRRLSVTVSCFKGVVRAFGVSSPDDGCEAGLSVALGSGGSLGGSAAFGSSQTPEWGETIQDYPSSYEGPGGSLSNNMGDYLSRSVRLQDVNSDADIAANVTQTGDTRSAQFQLSGSLIAMDGLYISRPTNDSFAVVDFGYPKLPVYLSNQPAGTTNGNGRLLIPNLVPDYDNQVSVDSALLPLSLSFENDEMTVTPPFEGGVYAKFPIQKLDAVLLKIRLSKGGIPPAGSLLYLQGSQTPLVIGYDGYAYIDSPPAHLRATLITSTSHCLIDVKITVSVRNAVVGEPVTCAS